MADNSGAARLDDPVQQALRGALDFGELLPHLFLPALGLGGTLVPRITQHRPRQIDELRRRLRLLQDVGEGSFHQRARHGLVLGHASALHAPVVGEVLVLALRPAGGHVPPAAVTDHEATQGEVRAGVLSGGRPASTAAAQNFLNGQVGLEADQRLVPSLAQRDTPRSMLEVTGVEDLLQHAAHRHQPDGSALLVALGEERIGLQKPRDLRLGSEAARREPFQRVADDRTEVLVDNEHLASPGRGLDIAVANGGVKHPEAALQPRPHLLRHLTGALRTLQFTRGSHHRFDELAFRSVLEAKVQAFHRGAARGQLLAQRQMKQRIASEALQIIEDDDVLLALVGVEVCQGGPHARTLHEITLGGDVIRENGLDLITALVRVSPATMLLALQATALGLLLFRRHPAVNDCEDSRKCSAIEHFWFLVGWCELWVFRPQTTACSRDHSEFEFGAG
ncbi:MAG: hypothetical protein U1E40_14130 [Amaricoccus sp.]